MNRTVAQLQQAQTRSNSQRAAQLDYAVREASKKLQNHLNSSIEMPSAPRGRYSRDLNSSAEVTRGHKKDTLHSQMGNPYASIELKNRGDANGK